jgi:hypothetical protein
MFLSWISNRLISTAMVFTIFLQMKPTFGIKPMVRTPLLSNHFLRRDMRIPTLSSFTASNSFGTGMIRTDNSILISLSLDTSMN